MTRSLTLWCAALGLAATASAYYPFVHFASRNAPFTPIPEKFDISALPNKTVPYFVSEKGPSALAPQDSFASVLSEIAFAASAWNGIASSDLRIAFGGPFTPGTPQTNARIEVLFDELPPGLLAMGGPTARGDVKTGPNGAFFPITRAVLILNPDLSRWPSYTESFFSTTLHEMGHALGLQHTFTSSAMSTFDTRASTRARPLADDDIAALSMLYPTGSFARQRGAISGQVVRAGQPAALASVVAIAPGRGAVSAIANPDGTYRIDGLAPGQYYVYAHPLPPSAQPELGPGEIVLPLDQDGQPFAASEPFDTVFFPGVKQVEQAMQLTVAAGATTGGIDFSVQPRADVGLYGVSTYSYPFQVPVQPAFINHENPVRSYLVAKATNKALVASGAPVSGLSVSVLGAPGAVQGVKAYSWAPDYLEIDIPASGLDRGPKHLVFRLNDDLYILPSGFTVAQAQPPSITAVTPAADGSGRRVVNITGTNLRADTRFYFDGLPGLRVPGPEDGSISVVPPPGPSGHTCAVIALNSDGQSSLFADAPPTYTYDAAQPPSLVMSQPLLTAGMEAMIEISGVNTNFANGVTTLGFGTSDITVKRIDVVSPTFLRAQVAVSPAAVIGPALLTASTGFELASPALVYVQPDSMAYGFLNSDVSNALPLHQTVFPGATAILRLSVGGLRTDTLVLLNGVQVSSELMSASTIAFQIPKDVKPGMAIVQVALRELTLSALIRIDLPPPVIANMWTGPVPIDAAHPVKAGDTLAILFAAESEVFASQTAALRVGDIVVTAPELIAPSGWPGYYIVAFPIPAGVQEGPEVPCVFLANGVSSLPFNLPVGPVPAAL